MLLQMSQINFNFGNGYTPPYSYLVTKRLSEWKMQINSTILCHGSDDAVEFCYNSVSTFTTYIPPLFSVLSESYEVSDMSSKVDPGPLLNIKMFFPGMGISIIKIDKMVMRPSHLYNGNPYTGKRCFYIEMAPWFCPCPCCGSCYN